MKNTTKLKNILQLYTVSLDMDDEGRFHLTLIHKRSKGSTTFIDKGYTVVVGKAFSHMTRGLKTSLLINLHENSSKNNTIV
jgi:hypothetical protein